MTRGGPTGPRCAQSVFRTMGYNPSLGVVRKFSPPMICRGSSHPREPFLNIRCRPPIRTRDFAGAGFDGQCLVFRRGAAAPHSMQVPRDSQRPHRDVRPGHDASKYRGTQKDRRARILRGAFAGRTHRAFPQRIPMHAIGTYPSSAVAVKPSHPAASISSRSEVSPDPLAPEWRAHAGNTPYRAAAARRSVGSTTAHPTNP